MKWLDEIKEEIAVIKERDPAIHSDLEAFLYPSFQVMRYYRRAHRHYLKGHYFRARYISQKARKKTGIEIHPGATIGKRLFIDHGAGVIIGETCEIGDDVTLYQGVTLGGTGKDCGKRHPTLGNNVMVGSGAKVLGPFKVGDNSRIAAGAVVLKEIPPDCTAVGVPARIVRMAGEKVNYNKEVDQIHVSDPVAAELAGITAMLEELSKKLDKLTNTSEGK